MVNEITTAISQRLNDVFNQAYEVHIDKLPQGFKEPCFFILTLQANQKQIVGDRYFRAHSFDIHYYPQVIESPARELNEVADRLWMTLEYINLVDGPICGTDMRCTIEDDVLHFFVNYNSFMLKQRDPSSRMRSLKQTQRIKE